MLRGAVPVLAAIGVLLAPIEMEGHARSALAIATAMIAAWLVEFLHPGMVGFIGSFLFVATGDVEFETAFAGFATPTPWFFYGVLLLYLAASRGGLTDLLRAWSPDALKRSVIAASIGVIVLAYGLALVVMSSLAKATMLALVATAWSTSAVPLLVGAYGAVAFGHAGLPGGPGAIAGWDVALGIALVAASFALSRSVAAADDPPVTAKSPAGRVEWKVALVVLAAVALWLTGPLHRATPELVGLAAGLGCWLPGIAPAPSRRQVTADPLALIFVGTALSIPAVLVETKAADVLVRLWLTTNESAGMLPHTLAYWSTTAYRLFSPDAARPALPALDGMASASVWAYAGGTLLSLHQSPALALAMSIGGCRARQVLIAGLLVLVAGTCVVMIF
jgi:hypothetical protein